MNILVADDHTIVRVGLIDSLQQLRAVDHRFFEAEDADQVLGVLASGAHLDLILLDLFMPGMDGFDLLSRVCAAVDNTPVVVLSASESSADMRKALDCGASGFIPKSTTEDLMLTALRLVLAGGVYVPAQLIKGPALEPTEERSLLPDDAALARMDGADHGVSGPISGAATEENVRLQLMTPRQREVLMLICEGRSNKQIARTLNVSEFTVKAHVAAILRVLGVANRIEAAVLARHLGLGQ